MQSRCEVCASFRPEIENQQPLEILFPEGIVQLCSGHAKMVWALKLRTLAELRKTFAENVGRRSFVGRRAHQRRRVEGPGKGRRKSDGDRRVAGLGRRSTDVS
jgi:hypothetical protein